MDHAVVLRWRAGEFVAADRVLPQWPGLIDRPFSTAGILGGQPRGIGGLAFQLLQTLFVDDGIR